MIFSIFLTSIISISAINSSTKEVDNSFIDHKVMSLKEKNSSTYLTKRGSYISFYSGESEIEDNEQNSITQYSNYGPSYIQGKSFEIGSTNTNNSLFIVGKSQIVNPFNNQLPEYNTVFSLLLPNIDTTYYSIREAGFAFKKQSGQLNNVSAYQVVSPSYDSINGTSIIEKEFLSFVSLGSTYAFLDITSTVIDCINSQDSNLTILLQSISNSQMCYLYNLNSQYAPYFYIEYDNFGTTREYYEPTGLVNCYGYSLFMNSGKDINQNLLNAFGTSDIYNSGQINTDVVNALVSILIHDGCTNVMPISSFDSLINSNQRRIAFRMKLDNINGQGTQKKYGGDYHFMWQCLDGTWAEKFGFFDGAYGHSSSLNHPNYNTSWNISYQSCPTYYFAISKY